MAESNATLGAIATLKHDNIEVAQLRDFSLGGISWEVLMKSNRDSDDLFHEKVAGFGDGGDLEFEAVYTAAGFAAMYALGGVTDDWTISIGTATLTFKGFVSELPMDFPYEDITTYSGTISISGKPVFTQGS